MLLPSSNVSSSAQFGRGKKRDSRNVSEMGRNGGRGGHGGCDGNGRGGCGGRNNANGKIVHCIDISDLTHYLSREKWYKLDN
jgi:hypothetical protein